MVEILEEVEEKEERKVLFYFFLFIYLLLYLILILALLAYFFFLSIPPSTYLHFTHILLFSSLHMSRCNTLLHNLFIFFILRSFHHFNSNLAWDVDVQIKKVLSTCVCVGVEQRNVTIKQFDTECKKKKDAKPKQIGVAEYISSV